MYLHDLTILDGHQGNDDGSTGPKEVYNLGSGLPLMGVYLLWPRHL